MGWFEYAHLILPNHPFSHTRLTWLLYVYVGVQCYLCVGDLWPLCVWVDDTSSLDMCHLG